MLNALAGVAALAVLALAGWAVSRHFLLGWRCFLAACAVNAYVGSNQAVVAGFHLDASDAVALALLAGGALRFLRRAALPGRMRLVGMAFLAVFALSFARGVAANGLFAAGVEARSCVAELLAILYFFTIPTDDATLEEFVRAYLWYGAALVLAALLHYAGVPVGDAAANVDTEGRDRALTVAGAATLAICLFLAAAWSARARSYLWRVAGPVCAGLVLILQHRTVWAILLVCLLASFFVDREMGWRAVYATGVAALLAAPLAVALYGTPSFAAATLRSSATNDATWQYRVEQWGAFLFEPGQTPTQVLFGAPLGTPYLHLVGAHAIYDDVGPHSEYVGLYTRFGLAGAGLFAVFMFYPLPRLYDLARDRSEPIFPSTSTWFLLALCNVVYGISYKLDPSVGVFLGVANALALRPALAAQSTPRRSPLPCPRAA